MEILNVNTELIPETSAFAQEVFIDYYTAINGYEHASYMAEKFLSEEAIAQLIDSGAVFLLLKQENMPVAFCEYIDEGDRIFLSKLYVHKDLRGKGLGRIMFERCKEYARRRNRNSIYLTVNKHNTPSYELYLHLGFKIIDSVVTDIGNGYVMDDYVMQLKINE